MDLCVFQNNLINVMKPILRKERKGGARGERERGEGEEKKEEEKKRCPFLIFEVLLSFQDLFTVIVQF